VTEDRDVIDVTTTAQGIVGAFRSGSRGAPARTRIERAGSAARAPPKTLRPKQSNGGREDFLPFVDRDRPAINKAVLNEGENQHLGGVVGVARRVDRLDPLDRMIVMLRRRSEEGGSVLI
jgi:hypothetical protein